MQPTANTHIGLRPQPAAPDLQAPGRVAPAPRFGPGDAYLPAFDRRPAPAGGAGWLQRWLPAFLRPGAPPARDPQLASLRAELERIQALLSQLIGAIDRPVAAPPYPAFLAPAPPATVAPPPAPAPVAPPPAPVAPPSAPAPPSTPALPPVPVAPVPGTSPPSAVAPPVAPGAPPASPITPAAPLPPSTGAVREVKAGEDLQAAIDAAKPGDTLVLQAGATFTGPITLRNKPGEGTITITSSGAGALPGPGGRVSHAHAGLMAKIVAPGRGEPAIQTEAGAHHYALVGLELTQADASATTYDLVRIGAGDASQTRLDQVPHHFLVDRCYLHGLPGSPLKRGIALNGAHVTVTGSHLSDFKGKGHDTQAISGWNGPGPFTLTNNFLQGAGENVMFGGADPTIPGLVPSDIMVTGNHFHKPLEWRGVWTVKNLFELKNARRVTVSGNVFENNWADGQNGHAILFTVRNQDGKAPWSVVEDVAFTRNVVMRSSAGVNILGQDNLQESQVTSRITVAGNLFMDLDGAAYGGPGTFLTLGEGARDVVVDHNTVNNTGNVITTYGKPSTGFVFTNNVANANRYGIHGDGTASGNAAIAAYLPGAVVRANVLVGAQAGAYPADGHYPASLDAVRFVSPATRNYRLAADSPYRTGATDGTAVGADVDALPVPAPQG